MKTDRAVVAAVPTYNMYAQVAALLPSLIAQNLDGVFVLDDSSTDGTVEKLNVEFGNNIQVVAGSRNLGAAANRNRIVEALKARGFHDDTLILFIDADTELVTTEPLKPLVQKLFSEHPEAGLIGAKVLNADDSWSAFNYGPLGLLKWALTSLPQLRIEMVSKQNPAKAKKLWRARARLLRDWPNPTETAKPKDVGWLVEVFTLIKLETFIDAGGYNPKLRYCESLDLGYKLKKMGLNRVFDPRIVARHLQIDNRGFMRNIEVARAIPRLIRSRL